jgi:hypothetical protein
MGRSVGLPLMLVSLVVGAILFAQQMRSQGPTSPAVTQAETQAIQATAATNFAGADEMLRAHYAENGTYAGATIDGSFGVTLVRADASSYCLQGGAADAVEHESGPNGSPQPGPC